MRTQYFDVYFPLAIATAEQLHNTSERFVYTTHSWLVSLYVDCPTAEATRRLLPLHCPDAAQLARFDGAVRAGHIRWHAYPFNAQPEVFDASLFAFGVDLTHALDRRYGLPAKRVMSQRDVPGMTRAVLRHLAARGVRGISVGVNEASAPPVVPRLFRWRDGNASGAAEVYAMWHPGGYGGLARSDCVTLDGLPHALCINVRGDNRGPPRPDEVRANYATLRREFPGADVVASSFDAFVAQLPAVHDRLPVVTGEIGDTWLYGVPSDPHKVRLMRALMRARVRCQRSASCESASAAFADFSRMLLKTGEHTWGMDTKRFLADFANWTNAQFARARGAPNYRMMVDSWVDQRNYLEAATAAVPPASHLAAVIRDELRPLLRPAGRPARQPGVRPAARQAQPFQCGRYEIAFDEAHGFVGHLRDRLTGRAWAGPDAPLARVLYQTFSADDVARFLGDYLNCDPRVCDWALLDFGKSNVSSARPVRGDYDARLVALRHRSDTDRCEFELDLAFEDTLRVQYGAPDRVTVQLVVPHDGAVLPLQVRWFNKTPTRLPESISLLFRPPMPCAWQLSKLGAWISPADLVANGSFHQHGVDDEGIACVDAARGARLQVRSLDATVALLGRPTPFPTPLRPENLADGVHFNLFNNLYGTNYILWYPFLNDSAPETFRFELVLRQASGGGGGGGAP